MKISQWRNVWDSKASRRVRFSVHLRIGSILLKQIEFCRFDVQCCSMLMTWWFTRLTSHDDQRTVQSTCAGLNEFFRDIGLSISESKTELVWFSRKHTNLSVCVTLNGRCMSVVPKFRYLGVVFDRKLLWGVHVHYIQQKYCKRINFLRYMAGVSW
jgi:hypothetical protein